MAAGVVTVWGSTWRITRAGAAAAAWTPTGASAAAPTAHANSARRSRGLRRPRVAGRSAVVWAPLIEHLPVGDRCPDARHGICPVHLDRD